jgi:hypothetical protein
LVFYITAATALSIYPSGSRPLDDINKIAINANYRCLWRIQKDVATLGKSQAQFEKALAVMQPLLGKA